MTSYHHPIIAREGWRAIVVLTVVFGGVQIYFESYWVVFLWMLLAAVFIYYRDPPREIPSLPLAVVAPVDGCIIEIRECTDGLLERAAICITIKKPWYNVMAIRSPMEGKIMQQWHERASTEKNITHNTFIQWVQSDEADDVSVSLQLLHFANRLRCYRSVGERIGQGQRCGLFPLSMLVDVMLPENTWIDVQVGDCVIGGSDTIATLVH
ncbi:MAG: phosphatidylserine decarboxylase [Thiohalomonadales bacterium]